MTDEMRKFRRGTFGDQKKINNPREEEKLFKMLKYNREKA